MGRGNIAHVRYIRTPPLRSHRLDSRMADAPSAGTGETGAVPPGAGAEAPATAVSSAETPVAAPAAQQQPAPEEEPRRKRRKTKGETLDSLVKVDTAPWEEATDVVVDIDKVRLDTTTTEGQIRTLRNERTVRLYEKMKKNFPRQRSKVVLWRTAPGGMPPPHPFAHS